MLIDLAKNQSDKLKSSHPEVQEYYHQVTFNSELNDKVDEEHKDDSEQFVELTIRSEGFKATPYSQDDMIHFQDLVETPSTKQGTTDNSKVLGLSVET